MGLGFSGLKDMKKNLVSQLRSAGDDAPPPSSLDFTDICVYSSTEDIIRGVEASAADAVRCTSKIQNPSTLEAVAQRIFTAGSIRLAFFSFQRTFTNLSAPSPQSGTS